MLKGAYVDVRGSGARPFVKLWIEGRHREFTRQEISRSFKRFALTPSLNLLLFEKGLAKPATPNLEWLEGEVVRIRSCAR